MKTRKTILLIFAAIFTLSLFTACSQSTGDSTSNGTTGKTGTENNGTENNGTGKPGGQGNVSADVQLVDYHFKVYNLPHDSEGLSVYAQAKRTDNKYTVEKIGEIKNYTADTCVEGTVKLPVSYTSLGIFLVDMDASEEGDAKYSVTVTDDYKVAANSYEIDGYYTIYEDHTYSTTTYYGINANQFVELEFGKEYSFNYQTKPYLLFYMDGYKGKEISVEIEEKKYSYTNQYGTFDGKTFTLVYWSSDIKKVMSYDEDLERLYDFEQECMSDRVYVLVKPIRYNFNDDKDCDTTSKITFNYMIPDKDKCLTIDKSIFASDGKLYASGTCLDQKTLDKVYQVEPETGERKLFAEVEENIKGICEYKKGSLVVVTTDTKTKYEEMTSIFTIDLQSGAVSKVAEKIPLDIVALIDYKDDKIVLYGNGRSEFDNAYDSEVFLVDCKSGAFRKVEENKFCYSSVIKDGFYIPEYDVIIYYTSTSPKDVGFLKIDERDPDKPLMQEYQSKYHTEYNMNYPIKLLRIQPLEIISKDGDIFKIDTNLIEELDPVEYYEKDAGAVYYTKIKEWCLFDRSADIKCDDYFVDGDYFYVMKLEKVNSLKNTTTVEKYSFDAPQTVIESCKFENETGVSFWKYNGNVYLQTSEWNIVYTNNKAYDDEYMLLFHKLDF